MVKSNGVKSKKITKGELVNKYLLIFIVGCIAGWIYEVLYYLIDDGYYVNRGFLYGPYLPVYGFGAILIYLVCHKFKKNPVIVFLLAFITTGILEYFTGYWMYKVYNRRWWDYTGNFLNIDGHVCLRSLITFGIGALILIYIAMRFIEKLMKKLGRDGVKLLNIVVITIMLIDTVLTILLRY